MAIVGSLVALEVERVEGDELIITVEVTDVPMETTFGA